MCISCKPGYVLYKNSCLKKICNPDIFLEICNNEYCKDTITIKNKIVNFVRDGSNLQLDVNVNNCTSNYTVIWTSPGLDPQLLNQNLTFLVNGSSINKQLLVITVTLSLIYNDRIIIKSDSISIDFRSVNYY